MAWTQRTPTSGEGSGDTSIEVTVPTGLASGDVVEVWIVLRDAALNATVTAPDGTWTKRLDSAEAGFGSRMYLFTKTAGSEGSQWVFSIANAAAWTYVCVAAAGGTGNVSGTPAVAQRASGATTYTSPSITPAADGALVRAGFLVDSTNDHRPFTPDASPAATADASVYGAGQSHNIFVERYEQPTAGAVSLDSGWNTAPVVTVFAGIIAWEAAAGGGGSPAQRLIVTRSNLRGV